MSPAGGEAVGKTGRPVRERRGGRANAFRAGLGALTALAVLSLAWIAAYDVMVWLYGLVGLAPGPLVRQVVASFVGILFITPLMAYGVIRRPREMATWESITSAIGRITQGDFGVRLETLHARPGHHEHPFSQLVHSINDMAEELDRMERLRQEFISNVSHEFQSPLTAIGGFAKALGDERLTPVERRRYLDIIETESQRLSKLGDNLLKLTALDIERPAVDRRPYRLDRQIQRIVLAQEPRWREKGIEMEIALPQATIVADEGLMDLVWANLLQNALEFTPGGGTVTIRLSPEADRVEVEVSDTGIGIAPSDQDRVFERFFRADRARTRETGGSGLGLALAKRIADLHGGRIGVESVLGAGATFRVSLPVLTQ